jgi:hypothetical protein
MSSLWTDGIGNKTSLSKQKVTYHWTHGIGYKTSLSKQNCHTRYWEYNITSKTKTSHIIGRMVSGIRDRYENKNVTIITGTYTNSHYC